MAKRFEIDALGTDKFYLGEGVMVCAHGLRYFFDYPVEERVKIQICTQLRNPELKDAYLVKLGGMQSLEGLDTDPPRILPIFNSFERYLWTLYREGPFYIWVEY
jgi:hypothetical protein